MLTDTKIRNTKPGMKQIKLTDGQGLCLIVTPSGGKWWRFRYTFGGKEKSISMGTYPSVSLSQARERALECRKQVANNQDPSAVRKSNKNAETSTFNQVAMEWLGKVKATWSPDHAMVIEKMLRNDLMTVLGDIPISQITPKDIIDTVRRIEARGALNTAARALTLCGQIFRYAVTTQRLTTDTTAVLKPGELFPNLQRGEEHFPAITDPNELAELLRKIDDYDGTFVTRLALRLAPLVFLRAGNLISAEWSEIDLETATWSIPAEKMKMRQPHIIPLSRQAIAIFEELKPLTGNGRYCFQSSKKPDQPISNNTLLTAIRVLGYTKGQMTIHGFRSTFRTIGDEILQFPYHLIEHQLAHVVRDPTRRSYNRTTHLPDRRKMMQTWADYLSGLKAGARVIPLRTGTNG